MDQQQNYDAVYNQDHQGSFTHEALGGKHDLNQEFVG